MNLEQKINLLSNLGEYMLSENEDWQIVKKKAEIVNPWFTQEFISLAAETIAKNFLDKKILIAFTEHYRIEQFHNAHTVGIIMAGNIPLVGFHDFLCVFLSGFKIRVKTSSKDELLIKHLVEKLLEWENSLEDTITFTPLLKGCDAYIATGSNNSGRYFDYYFGKFPNLIRRNRTSVAILKGEESHQDLIKIADDIHLYFGLGCRNVTKLYIPRNYNFIPLIEACKKYNYFIDHPKYKNNYEYYLAIHLLNNQFYMSSGSMLLVENKSLFSPISEVHYEFYDEIGVLEKELSENFDVQCITGKNHLDFGQAQFPVISDFADGADTMQFLSSLVIAKPLLTE